MVRLYYYSAYNVMNNVDYKIFNYYLKVNIKLSAISLIYSKNNLKVYQK